MASNSFLADALEGGIRIGALHTKLDRAVSPGGTSEDEVTVTLTKYEVAMLLSIIEMVLK